MNQFWEMRTTNGVQQIRTYRWLVVPDPCDFMIVDAVFCCTAYHGAGKMEVRAKSSLDI